MKRLPLPSVLRYPLLTRMGRYAPTVASGIRIRTGDVLARGEVPLLGSLHAGASGMVEATARDILLYPDGLHDTAPPLTAKDLAERVRDAGIIGLGGAGYPTWLKLRRARDIGITTLIVNAVECEPGVSADRALQREHTGEILSGMRVVADYVGKPRTVIALGEGMEDVAGTETAWVTGRYPSGSEHVLVQQVVGMDIGKSVPTDVGVLVLNVATVFAIHRAWHCGERLTERVVTVQDENAWLRIGHPVEELPLPEGRCGGGWSDYGVAGDGR